MAPLESRIVFLLIPQCAVFTVPAGKIARGRPRGVDAVEHRCRHDWLNPHDSSADAPLVACKTESSSIVRRMLAKSFFISKENQDIVFDVDQCTLHGATQQGAAES